MFLSVVASGIAAAAEPVVTCRLLLPPTAIPHDTGHTLMMEELTVPPGRDAHRHRHDTVEFLHVLSGEGSLSIEGRPDVSLRSGTVVTIPPRSVHQQHNPGTEPLIYTATFIAAAADRTVTRYVGERDHTSGCPHRR
jgi:quercetin dioxygenase-like cupin family protein